MHEKKYARRSLVDYESIRLPVYIREVGYKTYEDGDIQDAPPQRHSFFGNRSRPSFLTEPPSVGGNGQELVRANSKTSLL